MKAPSDTNAQTRSAADTDENVQSAGPTKSQRKPRPSAERSSGFIMLARGDVTEKVLGDRNMAILLLNAAFRASWGGRASNLPIGEAEIGDFKKYGLTRGEYREALKRAKRLGVCETRPIDGVGTIVRFIPGRFLLLGNSHGTAISPSNHSHLSNHLNSHPVSEGKSEDDNHLGSHLGNHAAENHSQGTANNEEVRPEDYSVGGRKAAKRSAFTPPSADEVAQYSQEIGYPLDGQAWCDHYASKGWVVGKHARMRDWRATVRNWKRNSWGGDGIKMKRTEPSTGGLLNAF